jgi:hypothetical protein
MKHVERQTEQLCRELLKYPDRFARSWEASANAILKHLQEPRPSPSSRYKGPGAEERRRARKIQRTKESGDLRAKAMSRALAACASFGSVVLGEISGDRLPIPLARMCHLNGGVGRKRETQSIENVVIDSDRFNRASDAEAATWLPAVQLHCERYGYPLPPRWVAIEAKLELKAALAAGGNRNG